MELLLFFQVQKINYFGVSLPKQTVSVPATNPTEIAPVVLASLLPQSKPSVFSSATEANRVWFHNRPLPPVAEPKTNKHMTTPI